MKSFTTDGVVLNMTYHNPVLVATPERRSFAGSEVVDPGRFRPDRQKKDSILD
jgi:hypothetical protein